MCPYACSARLHVTTNGQLFLHRTPVGAVSRVYCKRETLTYNKYKYSSITRCTFVPAGSTPHTRSTSLRRCTFGWRGHAWSKRVASVTACRTPCKHEVEISAVGSGSTHKAAPAPSPSSLSGAAFAALAPFHARSPRARSHGARQGSVRPGVDGQDAAQSPTCRRLCSTHPPRANCDARVPQPGEAARGHREQVPLIQLLPLTLPGQHLAGVSSKARRDALGG